MQFPIDIGLTTAEHVWNIVQLSLSVGRIVDDIFSLLCLTFKSSIWITSWRTEVLLREEEPTMKPSLPNHIWASLVTRGNAATGRIAGLQTNYGYPTNVEKLTSPSAIHATTALYYQVQINKTDDPSRSRGCTGLGCSVWLCLARFAWWCWGGWCRWR